MYPTLFSPKDHTITIKNPKINSNSALVKKRMAKAGAPPPPIQEQISLEEAETDPNLPLISQSKTKLGL
jgi:hypothetical protein